MQYALEAIEEELRLLEGHAVHGCSAGSGAAGEAFAGRCGAGTFLYTLCVKRALP